MPTLNQTTKRYLIVSPGRVRTHKWLKAVLNARSAITYYQCNSVRMFESHVIPLSLEIYWQHIIRRKGWSIHVYIAALARTG
jgi:hypothetical protein